MPRAVYGRTNIRGDGTNMTCTSTLDVKAVNVHKLGL